MVLYHGTSFDNFKKIVKDEVIKVATLNTTPYSKSTYSATTLGYVYLTDNAFAALEFASLAQSNKRAMFDIVVLEAVVKEEFIENDHDEECHNATTVNNAKCFRYNKAIALNDIKAVAIICNKSWEEICNIVDGQSISCFKWESLAEAITSIL